MEEIPHEHVDNLHDVEVEQHQENVNLVSSNYEQSEDELLVEKNKYSRPADRVGTSKVVEAEGRTSHGTAFESDLE